MIGWLVGCLVDWMVGWLVVSEVEHQADHARRAARNNSKLQDQTRCRCLRTVVLQETGGNGVVLIRCCREVSLAILAEFNQDFKITADRKKTKLSAGDPKVSKDSKSIIWDFVSE